MRLRSNFLLGLCGVLLLSGCGGYGRDTSEEALKAMAGVDELKETIPVSGVVTINGEPTANVEILAYTQESGMEPAVTVRTTADGKYAWTTYIADDGIVPGEYKLAFKHIVKEAKGNKQAEDGLQGKYRNPMQTGFELKVESGGEPQTEVNYDLEN